MSIEIHPHGDVIVRSPLRTPLYAIEQFLSFRGDWIYEKLHEVQSSRRVVPPLPSPNHIYHRGSVVDGDRRPETGDRSVRSHYASVIAELLPALGVGALRYKGFTVRKMRKRWGSCRSDGFITLNRYLIWTPDICIRSVIAHELAHVMYMDHGRRFHRLVREIMPDYDEANELLDAWTSALPRVEKKNGAQGPVEHRIVWLDLPAEEGLSFDACQLDTAQISSNALTSADAISSAMRPSM